MNKTVIAALSLSAVSLLVAIYAVASRPENPTPSSSSTAVMDNKTAAETAALETRLHAVEITADILARRVRSLEVAMVADGGVPQVAMNGDPALEAQVKALQGQVKDLSTGMVLDTDNGKQQMKEYVKEAQQELFEEQRQQRTTDWANGVAQQNAKKLESWKKFVGEASLNYSQESLLMQKMTEEQQKQQALIDQVRSGEKRPRDIRDDLRTLRTDTDQAMKQSLTPEQYKQYEDKRQEDRGPLRGGGGFGGFQGFGAGRGQGGQGQE